MLEIFKQKGRFRTHKEVTFDAENHVLHVKHGRETWQLDLCLCNNAAELCFWLFDLNRKPWASNDLVGQVFLALSNACRVVFEEDLADTYTPYFRSSPRVSWISPDLKKRAAGIEEGSQQ